LRVYTREALAEYAVPTPVSILWYRSKVFAWRKNAPSVVEAMTFFERGYLTKKFH
jgi:hypothetical protein